MVRRLIRMGAKVDVRDERGRTAWLMIGRPGYLECLKLLRAGGAELNQTTKINGYSGLHSAVQGEQVEVVQWLFQEGIDRNIKITNGKFEGMTARKMAETLGNAEILKILS